MAPLLITLQCTLRIPFGFFFFPMSHQLFLNRGEISDSVSYCFHAFFQHHIAWIWREYLLKVFQNLEKIEDDATLSTLVKFSISWPEDLLCQSWCVKFSVTCSLSPALSSVHLHRCVLVFFFSSSFSPKPRFTPTQALNYFFCFRCFTIVIYNEAYVEFVFSLYVAKKGTVFVRKPFAWY